MQHYLAQLLADLRAAHHNQPPPVDYRLLHSEYSHLPDEIAYVAEWENAPEQSFEELFGIPASAFPPEEKLTGEQMAQLVEAILELWRAWRMGTYLPEGAPPRLCYRVLTDFWRNEKIDYSSTGSSTLYLCNNDIPTCLWGEQFCECRDLVDDWDMDDFAGPSDEKSGMPF